MRRAGFAGHLTCGGHFATFNSDRLLDAAPAIDSVVLGEGEVTLPEQTRQQLVALFDD